MTTAERIELIKALTEVIKANYRDCFILNEELQEKSVKALITQIASLY